VIVLNLLCDVGHRFEGWFASANKFSEQREARQVICPLCTSHEIERAPCAPAIARSAKPALREPRIDEQKARKALQQLRKWVGGAENVGRRFPEEARRMHYGEAAARDIRGTATLVDMRDLAEEGISVLPVPSIVADEGH